MVTSRSPRLHLVALPDPAIQDGPFAGGSQACLTDGRRGARQFQGPGKGRDLRFLHGHQGERFGLLRLLFSFFLTACLPGTQKGYCRS